MSEFRNSFAATIFKQKYARFEGQTWAEKSAEIVKDVTENLMPKDMQKELDEKVASRNKRKYKVMCN